MKRKVTLLTVLMLTLSMLFALTACSSYGSIKKAYENAGYTESELLQEYQDAFTERLGEDYENYKSTCNVHLFYKNLLDFAIVLEFHSTKDMEEAYENSETLKGFIEDIQKSDFVNGNCVLVYASPLTNASSTFINA